MDSFSVSTLTTGEQNVLLRKLNMLSEERRTYLLKTYDLVSISHRINRYLSMERKERTMTKHEAKCKQMYQMLRRGFHNEHHSVFGSHSDPNMSFYGTNQCHNINDNILVHEIPPTDTSLLTVPKRITIETYRKRKYIAVDTSPLHHKVTTGRKRPSSYNHEEVLVTSLNDSLNIVKKLKTIDNTILTSPYKMKNMQMFQL